MSQNSFIKQYLAKQQELLRQRLEREAREAYDTNGKDCSNPPLLLSKLLYTPSVIMQCVCVILFICLSWIEQEDHTEVNNSTSCPPQVQVRHEFLFFSAGCARSFSWKKTGIKLQQNKSYLPFSLIRMSHQHWLNSTSHLAPLLERDCLVQWMRESLTATRMLTCPVQLLVL